MNVPELQDRTFFNLLKRRIAQKFGKNGAPSAPTGKALGAGLIGAGNIARWAYVPRMQRKFPFHLAAVFDVNLPGAKEVAASTGAKACASVNELVRDPAVEAVFICTPAQFHCDAAIAALEAGKHVLCEKPMAATLAEAQRMLDAAKQSGKTHMVHLSYRFRPEFRFLAELVASGIIGKVYHVTGTFSQGQWLNEKSEPSNERGDATPWKLGPDGGVAEDLGPHLMDLLRMALGEITEIGAWKKCYRPGTFMSDDACGVNASFASGAAAHVVLSRVATGFKERTSLEFSGSQGAIYFEHGKTRLWTRSDPRWRLLLVPQYADGDFLAAFHNAISNRDAKIPDFNDGLKNSEALEGIVRSAKTGTEIKLPLAA
jgi:UDP-N-acetylglucosamine 3-dehydrogenase